MSIPPHIEIIASQLLPKFIPKDKNETSLNFQFTIAPNTTYRVNYVKKIVKDKTVWELVGAEEVNGEQ